MRSSTTWAAIAAALVVHVALLGTVHALDITLLDTGAAARSPTRPQDAIEQAELKPTCAGDAFLALSARTAVCLAPWKDDVDECAEDAQMTLWIDLSSCMARNEPEATTVSLLEGKALERVKQIDPEKLMETPPTPVPAPPKPQELPQPKPNNVPPPPPPPPAPPRPMQVVETVKPTTEQAPDNARLLSEYDTKVEKEKVNRGARNEPMVAKAKPEELQPAQKPPDEPSVQKLQPDRDPGHAERAPDKPGMLSMRNPGLPHPSETPQDAKTRGDQGATPSVATADGIAHRRGDGDIEQDKHERGELSPGQNGAGGGAPPVPNLQPSREQLERALGGGNVDHLDDVDNGDETALSSKRWVYASFFNRLKRQVAQNWDPGSVWRRGDPTGHVWGFQTRITEVRVSLTPKGELTRIVVTQSCGVGDLDDEAIRAFHAAAPFPNPPEGLVSAKTNQITFAFSFFFEIGGSHTAWHSISS
jgi:TonB family protein